MAKKILIVDDSNTIRIQVSFTLKKAGYETVTANDGADGLKKLADHPDVALIVLDINMPNMGGMEMLTIVKKGPKANIPIIILTTEGDPAAIEKATKIGASVWMIKPFQPDHLGLAVKKLLKD